MTRITSIRCKSAPQKLTYCALLLKVLLMQINTSMPLKTSVTSFQSLFLLVLNLEVWQEDSDEKRVSLMVTIKSRILHLVS